MTPTKIKRKWVFGESFTLVHHCTKWLNMYAPTDLQKMQIRYNTWFFEDQTFWYGNWVWMSKCIRPQLTAGLLYKDFVTINVDHQKKGSYKIYDTHDVVKEDRKTAICPRMLQPTNKKKKQDIKEKINLQLWYISRSRQFHGIQSKHIKCLTRKILIHLTIKSNS